MTFQPGQKKTGGKTKGTKNKRTIAREQIFSQAAALLEGRGYEGDAHQFLQLVYKNLDAPVEIRIEAAKAALPFEKPRLAATRTELGGRLEQATDEHLALLLTLLRSDSSDRARILAVLGGEGGAGRA